MKFDTTGNVELRLTLQICLLHENNKRLPLNRKCIGSDDIKSISTSPFVGSLNETEHKNEAETTKHLQTSRKSFYRNERFFFLDSFFCVNRWRLNKNHVSEN